jgi:ubiquinone/menaquinone biosynthesis C-methylase UbiE
MAHRAGPSRDATGQFGPGAYADWRATSLGSITEAIERRLILRLAGPVHGRNVLDVGCGDGALLSAFSQNGAARIVGCDIDPQMIARASAKAKRDQAAIDYVIASAECLPFRDESFDLVSIITVLAFVPNPDLALREIARVLKPHGRLIIGDLAKWSLWTASRRIRGWLGLAPMWNAARFRTADELGRLVQAAQLRVEQVSGAIYYPRSRLLARLMAPLDPRLGELTTLGAAFLAVRASKA